MRTMIISLLLLCVCGCDDAISSQPDAKPAAVSEAATLDKKNLTPAQLAIGNPVKNSLGVVLVPIPVGKFLMGSPKSEANRGLDEHQHEVHLTKSFYLGRTEVTQD